MENMVDLNTEKGVKIALKRLEVLAGRFAVTQISMYNKQIKLILNISTQPIQYFSDFTVL